MKLTRLLDRPFTHIADFMSCRIVQPPPGREALRTCRIVSHRGDHDNRTIFENSLAAFDRAAAAGAWGIECDVRWSRDLCPMVAHDPDGARLFGQADRLSHMTADEIDARFPEIPRLDDVVRRYGGRLHLMVELKQEPYVRLREQQRRLAGIFSDLAPAEDFHFISLHPEMLEIVNFVPRSACLPIAEINVGQLGRLALDKGYGGILGHYYLVGGRRLRRHRQAGQAVGTAYIASRNCLYREINRGVRWVFTERTADLVRWRDESLTG